MAELTPFGERVARILHRRPHLGLEEAKRQAEREIEAETQRWIKQAQRVLPKATGTSSADYGNAVVLPEEIVRKLDRL